MSFQRQFSIMKSFKAIFLNSNLSLLYKVIKTEMGGSGLSVTASAAKKNNRKIFIIYFSKVHTQPE